MQSMNNDYQGALFSVYVVEGYYDPDNYNNPVKYRINAELGTYLILNQTDNYHFKVKGNVVNMLNGVTREFYTTELGIHDFNYEPTIKDLNYTFMLNHEYTQYDQYIDYEISPTARRLDSESSSVNYDIIPGHYFMFYIMSQLGGLYVFLHLIFGLLMNKWTEQHLKQTLMNELYSSIEAKSKSRSQALNQQTESNKSSKASPSLDIKVPHKNEQLPLINEQAAKMENRENQSERHNEPQINDPEGFKLSDVNCRNQNTQISKSFYNFKDALYGIFCCLK